MWAIYCEVIGTWQENRVPLGSREPTPLGVQGIEIRCIEII